MVILLTGGCHPVYEVMWKTSFEPLSFSNDLWTCIDWLILVGAAMWLI